MKKGQVRKIFSVGHGQVHVQRKLIQFYYIVIKYGNSVDPDQVISEEAT